MLLEEMTAEEKIEAIVDWFNDRPDIKFDLTFLESMEERLEFFGELTANQEQALDNIIESWKIEY